VFQERRELAGSRQLSGRGQALPYYARIGHRRSCMVGATLAVALEGGLHRDSSRHVILESTEQMNLYFQQVENYC